MLARLPWSRISRPILIVLGFSLPSMALVCVGWTQDAPSKLNQPLRATAKQLQHFETRVRPLLAEHCYACHRGEKAKGGLRLDSRAAILQGGESGPAIVPGDPDRSLLIQAMRYEGLEMPPKGKLSEEKIKHLSDWIRQGAPWPGADSAAQPGGSPIHGRVSDDDRRHWAFQPIRVAPVPELAAANPIDAWIESRLNAAEIPANPPAAPRTLIRRLFFTLTGLPPSVDELESWAEQLGADDAKPPQDDAYLRLVDELLARPAYGEHWGRHWLDVVRFAQSNGYERDGYKPESWRYRDYVVRAFQTDLPYDRFLLEQLAGDELPDSNGASRAATGFYRLGVWDDEPDDKRQAEFDELDDVMVTIGASFLGLTIGCARCHEHKFDPIPQADYYRLLAHVRPLRRYDNPRNALDSPSSLPISDEAHIRHAARQLDDRRRAREASLAQAPNDAERQRLQAQPLDTTLAGLEWALGARETPGEPVPTHVLIRGNAATPGPRVEPGFFEVLSPVAVDAPSGPSPTYRSESPLHDLFPSSGRRLALARWLADPRHPLTARVLVNRVWHYHFGRGIVATTGDFGRAGEAPSHPELLDWLADDFIRNGWSIKRLHRQIVVSAAFRRSSQIDATAPTSDVALARDPDNRMLWRFPLRRLSAESLRDRLLVSSGELDRRQGGREIYPRLSGEALAGQSKPGLGWEWSTPRDQVRRSLYAMVKRSVREPLLEAFDYSNTTSPLTERPRTTVAPQALLLLHGRFTAERSAALAERIALAAAAPEEQVRLMFASVLQRASSDREMKLALEALADFERDAVGRAGRITFRPDVPVSLFSGYRQQLPGEAFLLGPARSWQYRPGVWGGGYEGIDVVDPRLGPHAFWRVPVSAEGSWSGRLRFASSVELATLIARGHPEGAAWRGLGVTFDRTRGVVEFRDRAGPRETIHSAPVPLVAEQWIPFRWELTATRQRLWLGQMGAEQPPLLEQELASAEASAGHLGVAVWGGELELADVEWQGAGPTPIPDKGERFNLARQQVSGAAWDLPPGWSKYDGDWQRLADGSWSVAAAQGPKIVWDERPLARGEARVELRMTPGRAQIGGLLLCVSEPQVGADNWYGYEVSLDASSPSVLVGDHRHNFRLLARRPANIKPGVWHSLRATVDDRQLSVFLDGAAEPIVQIELADRLPGKLVGLRTWGSEIQFRNFEVREGDRASRAEWPAPRWSVPPPEDERRSARREALATLARTLFNLSEFAYVD